jgi:hypothetical protein
LAKDHLGSSALVQCLRMSQLTREARTQGRSVAATQFFGDSDKTFDAIEIKSERSIDKAQGLLWPNSQLFIQRLIVTKYPKFETNASQREKAGRALRILVNYFLVSRSSFQIAADFNPILHRYREEIHLHDIEQNFIARSGLKPERDAEYEAKIKRYKKEILKHVRTIEQVIRRMSRLAEQIILEHGLTAENGESFLPVLEYVAHGKATDLVKDRVVITRDPNKLRSLIRRPDVASDAHVREQIEELLAIVEQENRELQNVYQNDLNLLKAA